MEGYKDIKVSGLLQKIYGVEETTREANPSLVTPERFFSSRVVIDTNTGSQDTEVIRQVFPRNS